MGGGRPTTEATAPVKPFLRRLGVLAEVAGGAVRDAECVCADDGLQ
jgi:hypothetical protein